MTSLNLCGLILAGLFGGATVGMLLRRFLPDHHTAADSKDTIKVGTGLIATMAALVLGLLVGSAKGSYDTQKSELTEMSAKVIILDRVLAHYGPETKETRELLRSAVERMVATTWSEDGSAPAQLDPTASSGEIVLDKIQSLTPKNETQRTLQAQAVSLATDISQLRWLLFQQSDSAISSVFLAVLVFWLVLIFVGMGLFAPCNSTVILTVLMCAVSVAGALFLILELDRPFDGVIRITSQPVRNALMQLGK